MDAELVFKNEPKGCELARRKYTSQCWRALALTWNVTTSEITGRETGSQISELKVYEMVRGSKMESLVDMDLVPMVTVTYIGVEEGVDRVPV